MTVNGFSPGIKRLVSEAYFGKRLPLAVLRIAAMVFLLSESSTVLVVTNVRQSCAALSNAQIS